MYPERGRRGRSTRGAARFHTLGGSFTPVARVEKRKGSLLKAGGVVGGGGSKWSYAIHSVEGHLHIARRIVTGDVHVIRVGHARCSALETSEGHPRGGRHLPAP